MKARLLEFIDDLRAAGLPISPAETLDAARALALFGVDPHPFREALAATVVKDEADRAIFDDEFARFFTAPLSSPGKRKHREPSGSGERAGLSAQPSDPSRLTVAKEREERHEARADRRRPAENHEHGDRQQVRSTRRLQDIPFTSMTPQQIEECDLLLRRLAEQMQGRYRRRLRAQRHGRLDLRRTLRRSIASGGVPIVPEFRKRRPGKPDLVALCDLSHSVALSTRFLLSLLSGAPFLFRRARLFGYVDGAVEIWLQDAHLVQDEPLDLYARSDFGRVLTRFWERRAPLLTRNTLLLILGDARNNRRPPRGDVLGRMQQAVRRVVWLNPEPRDRWNTGDSVARSYAPYCSDMLAAATPRQLYLALELITR